MMAWLQQISQILIPVCGLVAGLITVLAATTKLIHALTKFVKEFHKRNPNPPNDPKNESKGINDKPTSHLNGSAKNGTVPTKDLLRDLGRSITRGKQTYIEVKPREQKDVTGEREVEVKE